MTATDDSELRLIGTRADGYLDYYDETTDTVFREPETQYDYGLAGAIPSEWVRNPEMTLERYIERTERDSGWARLSRWAAETLGP
ncbi:hypothetical protein [Natronorubrum sp. FCH18a]|uniref:hypothetical protein n=1 Tax=Natronorubrum sp. FCH18a TaxID=3447018 RepID=UPI003F51057D